ncbi:MAG: DUF3817 domain-containing protein [Pseudomonadales bacterium]|nr:DUF3817 domain-containing protein [Pseudomonadales bacterium]
MLKYFRVCSLFEGISYLLILSVSAGIISRDFVFYLGLAHGLLFMGYMFLSLQASHKQGWSIIVWLLIFFASIIPFAFIGVEAFLQKEMRKDESGDK